jgi:glycosyltransferase involved in cell wall biosynthesis
MKVTVVVYTLNEIDGMKQIMPLIKKEWYDELIIIDGGSTDGTIEYAKEHGYAVYVQEEPHWAGGYKEAHKRATGDVIIDFSPDGNSVPEVIPQLVKKMQEGYDMVIASRYEEGAVSEDDSWLTSFGNALFTGMINLLFRAKYSDVLVIYRAYRKEIVYEMKLDRDYSQAFTSQISIRAAKFKKKVTQIPGDEPPRVGGQQKMNPLRDGFRNLFLILREFIFYRVK